MIFSKKTTMGRGQKRVLSRIDFQNTYEGRTVTVLLHIYGTPPPPPPPEEPDPYSGMTLIPECTAILFSQILHGSCLHRTPLSHKSLMMSQKSIPVDEAMFFSTLSQSMTSLICTSRRLPLKRLRSTDRNFACTPSDFRCITETSRCWTSRSGSRFNIVSSSLYCKDVRSLSSFKVAITPWVSSPRSHNFGTGFPAITHSPPDAVC